MANAARGAKRLEVEHTQPLDNTVAIETPEHVQFRHFVAGPTRRCLAYLIDALIRGVVFIIAALCMRLASGTSEDLQNLSNGLILVLLFVSEWAYYVLFETLSNGRTPGKRSLGLRVVKEGGEPINFVDSVLRNLLRAADFLPIGYGIAVLSMVSDRRFRRLGDRVAATMVVIEERSKVAAPPVLDPPAHPEELSDLPMRLPLSTNELLALDAFVRRGALSGPRREELALMVAPLWATRMNVSFTDPVRFLSLLHLRAWGSKATLAFHGQGRPR